MSPRWRAGDNPRAAAFRRGVEHGQEEVHPVCVGPGLQHRQQDAAGPAGDVKDWPLCLPRQADVEVDAVVEALAQDVVELAVVERRGLAGWCRLHAGPRMSWGRWGRLWPPSHPRREGTSRRTAADYRGPNSERSWLVVGVRCCDRAGHPIPSIDIRVAPLSALLQGARMHFLWLTVDGQVRAGDPEPCHAGLRQERAATCSQEIHLPQKAECVYLLSTRKPRRTFRFPARRSRAIARIRATAALTRGPAIPRETPMLRVLSRSLASLVVFFSSLRWSMMRLVERCM